MESKTDIQRAAAALGRLGGLKGGIARAQKLSPEERTRIAQKAARARWGNKVAYYLLTRSDNQEDDPESIVCVIKSYMTGGNKHPKWLNEESITQVIRKDEHGNKIIKVTQWPEDDPY
jgi:hypothetical protein